MTQNTHFSLDQSAIAARKQWIAGHLLEESHVYHEIINRLLSRLDIIKLNPKTILNVGWYTKDAEIQLQKRFQNASILSIQSLKDISGQSVDLCVMHFSLLYEPHALSLLQAISGLLNNEGLLLFASLGPDTLIELRRSFSHVDSYPHVHSFTDMHHIGDWMKQLHFSDPVMDREEITLAYDELNLLFDDLKNGAALNAHQNRFRGLLSKNKWQRMLLHYAEYKKEDYFPATLEVIYGHGWKVAPNPENNLPHEVMISIDQIKIK